MSGPSKSFRGGGMLGVQFRHAKDPVQYETFIKDQLKTGIMHYTAHGSYRRVYDSKKILVQDSHLVRYIGANDVDLSLTIYEIYDEQRLSEILRELEVLKQLGISKNIMSLLLAFRHRQFIAIVQPAYIPFRYFIDMRKNFKEHPYPGTGRFEELYAPDGFEQLAAPNRERDFLDQKGLFKRDSVAHVMRRVVKGLKFMHSKGFVHTEICADNVFINRKPNVKIGGFMYAKKLGSRSWKFAGDQNTLPPEAFLNPPPDNLCVDASFDSWAVGLLAIEIITGHRNYNLKNRSEKLSGFYKTGEIPLPSLKEFGPDIYIDDKNGFDPYIDDFIEGCLMLEPSQRLSTSAALAHPFLSKKRDRTAIEMELRTNVDVLSPDCPDRRNLYREMKGATSTNTDLDLEFLQNVVQAIRHVESNDYPIFKSMKVGTLINEYVGVEASVAMPADDSDWSREVLNISERDVKGETEELHNRFVKKKPLPGGLLHRKWYPDLPENEHFKKEVWPDQQRERAAVLPQLEDIIVKRRNKPPVDKDYQRYEICFFVDPQWKKTDRQTFIAMQYARWYTKNVIEFSDLIRVTSETNEVIEDYAITKIRLRGRNYDKPDAIYFASGRRIIQTDPSFTKREEDRYLHHIYIDVAIERESNRHKLHKLRKMMADNPVPLPEGVTTLQASVTYRDIDPLKFLAVEQQMLGLTNVADWQFDENQKNEDRRGPETVILELLYERRRNPNRLVDPNDISGGQYSNEATRAKIFGEFCRDYFHKVVKRVWDVQLDKEQTSNLYGTPESTREDLEKLVAEQYDDDRALDSQLYRTQRKQEKDFPEQFIDHEDVGFRQEALDRYNAAPEDERNASGYLNLSAQLRRGKGAGAPSDDLLVTPRRRLPIRGRLDRPDPDKAPRGDDRSWFRRQYPSNM